MREMRYLEFKQEITNSFLKTVSAYANYGTGKILFGVLDNGNEYELLKIQSLASSAIIKSTGFGKNKSVLILNDLVEKGYIKKTGNGRGTKYRV